MEQQLVFFLIFLNINNSHIFFLLNYYFQFFCIHYYFRDTSQKPVSKEIRVPFFATLVRGDNFNLR